MKHLARDRCHDECSAWCTPYGHGGTTVEDPREADCVGCLREAASYGAAAAMRCAAVEAGGSSDPELREERDHALAELDKLRGILGQHELFACAGCSQLFHIKLVGFHVGLTAWCAECAGARGRIL